MTVVLVAISGALVAVFGGFFAAFFRAIFLFFPTMILFGAVHSHLPFVPALGWVATFFVVALISILIPTSTSVSNSKT